MLAKLPTDRAALLEAADLIEERGHCKHTRKDTQGRHCVMGAISMVLHDNPYVTNTFDPPGALLSSYLGGKQPVFWNNAEERTKDEVVNALRGAALHGL